MTLTEFSTLESRLEKAHQVKVLEDDINNVVWEKAHLSLFYTIEPNTTRWGQMLRRLNAAYLRGDDDRFRLILEDMKDMVARRR